MYNNSDYEYFCYPFHRILVNPSEYFLALSLLDHIYTVYNWVGTTTMQVPWKGLEPGPHDLEYSAVIIRQPCLPQQHLV